MSKIFDKSAFKDLNQQFEELGFTEKESAVYLALLSRDFVGSSKIILATGLHGQYVYNALESLEEKGMVKHVVKNGRKKWSANPPSRLKSIIAQKEIVAERLGANLMSIMNPSALQQEFEVFQGENSFITNEFDLVESAENGDYIDIIGGEGDRFFEILGDRAMEYERLREEKNIQVRYIGSKVQTEYLSKIIRERKNFDFRIMPGLSTGLVNTNIRPKSVTFNIHSGTPLAFMVINKEIAESYRNFFESLWAMSK